MSEDAFIDFRVVDQLLAGHGPVFNAGERVEAYTNPLWVAILAGGAALGAPPAWTAVLLGLALAVTGLLAAQAAGARWPGADRPAGLPLGVVVLATLPPAWDFATSGLETGLTLAWLGITPWLLARHARRRASAARAGAAASPAPAAFTLAALAGLGPLVRPDLAVFSVAFLGALLVIDRPRAGQGDDRRPDRGPARRRLPRLAGLAVAAGALPVAYQIFRMGYFAALVPNTALAKEAGRAHWAQGGRYLVDVLGTYYLVVPLLLLLPWLAARVATALRHHDRPALALTVLPLAAALLHAVYVTRVGGDFMHGRLLLPALFGVLLPVAAVPLPPTARPRLRRLGLAAALGVGAWAAVCAVGLRVPYAGGIGPDGIADERGFYVGFTGRPHPVDEADYADTTWGQAGRALRLRAAGAGASGPRLLLLPDRALPLASGVTPAIDVVATARNIGLQGYLAGPRVHLVDEWGLSDPLASRLRLDRRTRPGHEKSLAEAWVVARFAHPAIPAAMTPHVLAARQALACGDLATLRDAVEGPVTLRGFLANVVRAGRLHRLRIAPDPLDARAALCGARRASEPAGLAR